MKKTIHLLHYSLSIIFILLASVTNCKAQDITINGFIYPPGSFSEKDIEASYLPHAIQGKNGKWGYIQDSSKKMITSFIYDEVNQFYYGFASVKLNSKCGIIDKKGTVVIPLIYSCK